MRINRVDLSKNIVVYKVCDIIEINLQEKQVFWKWTELVAAMAEKADASKKDADNILKAFKDLLK